MCCLQLISNFQFLDIKFKDNIDNDISAWYQNLIYAISLITTSSKYLFMRLVSIKNPEFLHGNIIINDLYSIHHL